MAPDVQVTVTLPVRVVPVSAGVLDLSRRDDVIAVVNHPQHRVVTR